MIDLRSAQVIIGGYNGENSNILYTDQSVQIVQNRGHLD